MKKLLLLPLYFVVFLSVGSNAQTFFTKSRDVCSVELTMKSDPILRLTYVHAKTIVDAKKNSQFFEVIEDFQRKIAPLSGAIQYKVDGEDIWVPIILKAEHGTDLGRVRIRKRTNVDTRKFLFIAGEMNILDLESIVSIEGVKSIEQIRPLENEILDGCETANIDDVWKGNISSFSEYTIDGSGVIIGQVEGGIPNTSHEFFNDGLVTTDMSQDGVGFNPTSHATSVAGIMVGNPNEALVGPNPPASLRGIAPGAEFFFAGFSDEFELISGVQNMINGKGSSPLVVNMSAGWWYSPRDGSLNYEQLLNAWVEDGDLIFVKSAGNARPNNDDLFQHYGGEVPGDMSQVDVPLNLSNIVGEDPPNAFHFFFYYPDDKELEFWVEANGTNQVSNISEFGIDSGIPSWNLPGSDDQVFMYNFDMTPVSSQYPGLEYSLNTGLNLLFITFSKGDDMQFSELNYTVHIRTNQNYNTTTSIDGYHSEVSGYRNIVGYTEGDNHSSITSPGCTENIITVAAHSKNNIDEISNFSSQGPTRIGTEKPDITVTGENLWTPIWDTEAPNVLDQYSGSSIGTSFAAPIVTGAIALILQSFPDLNGLEIKTLLKNSADSPSGEPSPDDWGAGRLNLLAAYQNLVGYDGNILSPLTPFVLEYNSENYAGNDNKGLPIEPVENNWGCDGCSKQELTNGVLFYDGEVASWLGEEIWTEWVSLGDIDWGMPLGGQYIDLTNNFESVDFDNGCSLFYDGNEVSQNCSTDIPISDGFEYPISCTGGILEEQIFPEQNNLFPDNPTESPVRGSEVSSNTWYNLSDVGNYLDQNYASTYGIHPGEDWNFASGCDDAGKEVYAVANGKILKITSTFGTVECGGWTILIKHQTPDNEVYYSIYTHVTTFSNADGSLTTSESSFSVSEGQNVTRGEPIARVAKGTNCSGSNTMSCIPTHLHFEMRDNEFNENGQIWASDNGNGYYGNGIGSNGIHLDGMTVEQVQNAFQNMRNDGIIDPSDFIDANPPLESSSRCECTISDDFEAQMKSDGIVSNSASAWTVCNSDGTFNVMVQVSGLPGGVAYSISAGNQVVNDIVQGETYTFFGFLSDENVYITIYESNNPECYITPSPSTVSVDCTVDAPTFITPQNTVVINDNEVDFTWDKPLNPDGYYYRIQVTGNLNLQVHPEYGFYSVDPIDLPATSEVVVNKQITTASSTPSWLWSTSAGDEVYETPQPGKIYRAIIRAAGESMVSGGWSQPISFEIYECLNGNCPPVVTLVSPPDGYSVNAGDAFSLTWFGSVPGGLTILQYELQMSTESTFPEGPSTSSSTTTQTHASGTAPDSGTIYWRVKAQNSLGQWGEYSNYRTLNFVGESVPPDWDLMDPWTGDCAQVPGGIMSVCVDVANLGGDAPETEIAIYLDDDFSASNGYLSFLGTETVGAINSGESLNNVCLNISIPYGYDNGSYYIVFEIDPDDNVVENNENNNQAFESFHIVNSLACEAPSNFSHISHTESFTEVFFSHASNYESYEVEVYQEQTLISEGTVTWNNVNVTNLQPCTNYEFRIRTNCVNCNSSNWTSYSFITPGAGDGNYPNFFISGETASISQVQAGDNVCVNWDVSNAAYDYCGTVNTSCYLDSDMNPLNGFEQQISIETITEPLSQWEFYSISECFVTPNISPGIYYIAVCVDIQDNIVEGDNDDSIEDNCEFIELQIYDPNDLADLIVSNVNISPSCQQPEQDYFVDFDVENIGTQDVTDNFFTYFYIDDDTNISNGIITELGDVYCNDDIGVDQSKSFTNKNIGQIPEISEGDFYLIICTDSHTNAGQNNQVLEMDESNNCVALAICIDAPCNDPNEPNDSDYTGTQIPFDCLDGTFTWQSSGACIGTDEEDFDDWYVLGQLISGFEYEITFTPLDRDDDPQAYSGKIEFELHESGFDGSEYYDVQTFTIQGQDDVVEIEVEPFAANSENSGSYSFKIDVVCTPTSDCVDPYEPNSDSGEETIIPATFVNNTYSFSTAGACCFEGEVDVSDFFRIDNLASGYDYNISVDIIDINDGVGYTADVEFGVYSDDPSFIWSTYNNTLQNYFYQGNDQGVEIKVVPEGDDDTNCGTYQLNVNIDRTEWVSSGVDLVVREDIIFCTNYIEGTDMILSSFIENIGGTAGGEDTRVGYYLSADANWDLDDDLIDDDSMSPGTSAYSDPMDPGDIYLSTTVEVLEGLQVPPYWYPNNVPPGDYFIIIYADYDNSIIEDNENNNWVAVPITILPEPGTLALITPNCGEAYAYEGCYYTDPGLITDAVYASWTQGYCSSTVDIYLSEDGGNSWEFAMTTSDDGYQNVCVKCYLEDFVGGEYLLKIQCSDNPSIYDISEEPFTITTGLPVQQNDEPCNATLLDVTDECLYAPGDLVGASLSNTPNPECTSSFFPSDVWYKFEAPNGGSVQVEIDQIQNFYTRLAFYSGTCNNLLEVDCVSNTSSPYLLEGISPGATIFIRVFSTNCLSPFGICLTDPDLICNLSIDNWVVNNEICDQSDGSIENVQISGQLGGLNYSWENSNGEVIGTTSTLTGVSSGNYTLVVSDNVCSQEIDISIPNTPGPTLSDGQITNEICLNNQGAISGIIVSNGTGLINYEWKNEAELIVGTTLDISGLQAGTYTLTATDENNCQDQLVFIVENEGSLSIVPGEEIDASCGLSNGAIIGTQIDGGFGIIELIWENEDNIEVGTNLDIFNIPAGGYTFTASDESGCTASYAFNIGDTSNPVIDISQAIFNDETCNLSNGSISGIIISSGTPDYSYEWITDGQVIATTQNLNNAVAANYIFRVTDEKGCFSEIELFVNASGVLTINDSEIVISNSTCGEANGSIEGLSLSGGTGNFIYTWLDDQSNIVGTTLELENLLGGVYTLQAEDDGGCFANYSVEVMASPSIQIDASSLVVENETCTLSDGSIKGLLISGGESPFDFYWTNENGDNVGDNIDLLNIPQGTYSLLVSDANNCEEILDISVFYEQSPLISDYQVIESTCGNENGSVTSLTITGGIGEISFQWLNSDNILLGSSQDLLDVFAGEYTLIVTDENNCSDNVLINIGNIPGPQISNFEVGNASCLEGDDGFINLNISGGTPSYDYLWSNGDITEDLSNLAAGTYSVLVTDGNNCVLEAAFNVNLDGESPVANFSYQSSGLVVQFTNMSSGYSNSTWTFGDGQISVDENPNHTFSSPGIYNVCLDVTNTCGSENSCLDIEVTNNNDPIVMNYLNENQISIHYPNPVDPNSVSTSTIMVNGEETGYKTGSFSVSGNDVTFSFNETLNAGEKVFISTTSSVLNFDGGAMQSFGWVKHAPVTNMTDAEFSIVNSGIVLPSEALDYSFDLSQADFDKNGKVDVVVRYSTAYGNPTNILIYLQNLDGTFSGPDSYSNSYSHSGIRGVGDLNNDGYPDLILTHNYPSRVHVRLNNGDGTFSSPTLYIVSNFSNGVEIADIDNDGDIDIIGKSGYSYLAGNTISILKNNGDGTFQNQITVSTGTFASSALFGDCDNDGDMDYLYTSSTSFNSAATFRVYENDGLGNYSLFSSEGNPDIYRLVLGEDYNGDGHFDFITTGASGSQIQLGDGTLNFSLGGGQNITSEYIDIVNGDLNGDGAMDLFNSRTYNGTDWETLPFKTYLNVGGGTFNEVVGSTSLGIRQSRKTTDIDKDGDVDFLFVDEDKNIYIALNGPVETIPECTNLLSPLDGATDVLIEADITWLIATGATGYIIYVGTTPGGGELVFNEDVGNVTTFDLPTLEYSTTYYVSIIPYNDAGNAEGCVEESFSTKEDTCPDLVIDSLSFFNGEMYARIKNVGTEIANLANVSIKFSYSTDGTPTTAYATQLQYGATGPDLAPGEFVVHNNLVDQNFNNYPYIVGEVDVSNVLEECIETNNVTVFDLIFGCTDSDGHNYSPDNNSDDGSCETCFDGLQNGDETEVDCGGVLCPACLPGCTSLTTPIDGSTDVSIEVDLTWLVAPNATGYYVSIGTSPGATDILDNVLVTGDNFYDLPVLNYNNTYYVIIIPFNESGNAEDCFEESFTTESGSCSPPETWGVNPASYEYSGEITGQVFLDGVVTTSGTIAAFVGDECRGVASATYFPPSNHYVFTLLCYSNSASGEMLTFKYFDEEACEVCDLTEQIEFAPDMVLGNAVSPVPLNCTSEIEINIDLNAGWTWFSVNVISEDMSLNNVLASIPASEGDYIKNQTVTATYYEGYGWFGELGEIDPKEMYMIKLANPAMLTFTGLPVDLLMNSIPLNQGWTWIGYLPQQAMNINYALESLSPTGNEYIKGHVNTSTFYAGYEWFGSLESMVPFEGYKINMNNPDMLDYPVDNVEDRSNPTNYGLPEFEECRINPALYEFNGSITAQVYDGGKMVVSEGDLLMAFDEERCKGIVEAMLFPETDTYNFPIMVFGNQLEGTNLQFKYYNATKGDTYDCIETIEFYSDMISGNALRPIPLHLSVSLTSTNNVLKEIEQFDFIPNPFSNSGTITYSISGQSQVKILVNDIYGNLIEVLSNDWHQEGNYSIIWTPNRLPDGTYFVTMITPKGKEIKKVVLMN